MKYSIVLQQNEADCGAACLATAVKYHNRKIPISQIREAIGDPRLGNTIIGLKRGAENLGFIAQQVRASPELLKNLRKLSLPAIIHWQGYHWVVLYGKDAGKYVIADPAVGIRYLTTQELLEAWTNGLMLLLNPGELQLPKSLRNNSGNYGHFVDKILSSRHLIIEIVLLNIIFGVLALVLPLSLRVIVDEILNTGDTQFLANLMIGVIFLTLFQGLVNFFQANLIANFTQHLNLELVLKFLQKVLDLPLKCFYLYSSQEITGRLSEIGITNQLIAKVTVTLPGQIFAGIASLFLMLIFSLKLTIVAIFTAMIMGIIVLIYLPLVEKKTQRIILTIEANQSLFSETYQGAITVKSNNTQSQIWSELNLRFGYLANLILRKVQTNIFSFSSGEIVEGLSNIIILWMGSYLVITGEISLGQLLAFYLMKGNVYKLLELMLSYSDELALIKTSNKRLSKVTDNWPQESQKSNWIRIQDQTDIIISNLGFSYSEKVTLLQDISVVIPGGKVTAIIGKSGCGKSTLAKLITRLYTLDQGNISYGNYNQQDLDLECLRQQVVLVPQESNFWNRSLVDNFRLIHPDANLEAIVQACQIVCADEFIKKLPDKYQTILGESAVNLAAGEKQRLAIARAVVKNPPILILDESTSLLDPILEAEVLERLLEYRRGKTTILITHSPRVIRRSDWVILLAQGGVKRQGTPNNLIQVAGEHLPFLNL